MNDASVYDLLRQDSIKTENHFMDFYDSSRKYCPDTERNTGEYIILYQGAKIDHVTHVPVPVVQSGAKSKYNAEFTTGYKLCKEWRKVQDAQD